MLEDQVKKHIDLLIKRYPMLENCRQDIINGYLMLEDCYAHGGKLLIAGNGGSAADAEHIAGELMKRFKTPRPVPNELKEKSFEYELYYNDTTLVKKGNFAAYNSSSNVNGISYATSGTTTLTLFTGRDISTTSTDKYTLYLWFNGKDYTNPNTMQSKKLSFDLYATGENAVLAGN